MERDYYTKAELAEYLGISVNSLTTAYRQETYSLPKKTQINKVKYIILKEDYYDWKKSQKNNA
jgi:hypothetical protein